MRITSLVQQHLSGLILNTILGIVEDLGDPYQAKPGLGGMTAYPPKAMTVVCILMEAEARTYRKMVGHLRMNRGLAMKIGLPKIPSKSTIWRACGMIPEPYLREVHTRIIGDVMVTGSLAGDSTGYSGNRFIRWFSIRHGQVRLKRGWVKLHSIVDVSTRTVLDYLVTDGYASDVAGMWPMLGRIEEGSGFFWALFKYSNPRCARSNTCESLGHPHHAHGELNLAWVKPPYSAARVIICA